MPCFSLLADLEPREILSEETGAQHPEWEKDKVTYFNGCACFPTEKGLTLGCPEQHGWPARRVLE